LRFIHQGKRYAFAIGLPDNLSNRKYAEWVARQIALEMLSGHFDPTLSRYKPTTKRAQLMPIQELFTRFMSEKEKSLYWRSLEKYTLRSCTRKSEGGCQGNAGAVAIELLLITAAGQRAWEAGVLEPIELLGPNQVSPEHPSTEQKRPVG
jgi:hypothetical protein